jgi:hypothetical protein
MKLVIVRSFLLVFAFAGSASAQDHTDSSKSAGWYVPRYIPVQFAGNIGLFSTGLGYTSNHDNFHLNILYGYVPASVALTDVHTITFKNIFPITRCPLRHNQTLIPYLGLGLSIEVGGISFLRMPEHYPDSYYDFPKNLHVLGFGGVSTRHLFTNDARFLKGLEFYAEAGSVDLYLWYKTISRQIRLRNIFSLALGVNLLLHP